MYLFSLPASLLNLLRATNLTAQLVSAEHEVMPYITGSLLLGTQENARNFAVYSVASGAKYKAFGFWRRLEFEFSHFNIHADRNDMLQQTRFETYKINHFSSYFNDFRVRPYIGIGAGLADLRGRNLDVAGGTDTPIRQTRFAFNTMTGIEFNLTEELNLDIGLRLIQVGGQHTIYTGTIGVRWYF